jgi:type I restriction enzyme M protein
MTEQNRLPGYQTDDPVETVPEGKLKCFITNKLRADTPEEKVRQMIARGLVEEYGYNKDDIGVEKKVKMGRSSKSADLIVYPEGKKHVQANAYIIVETKSDEIKPSSTKNGVDQLESYVAACINTKFALWVGSERLAFRIEEKDGGRHLEEVPDIPRSGEHSVPKPTVGDLTPAANLKEVFERVHNYIYANQGFQKDRAFEELLKLIFIKVYDERYSMPLQFYVLPEQGTSAVRNRLNSVFTRVKNDFDYIFENKEDINLNDSVLKYIVSELQRFSFVETSTDIKGEAYEELVGPNLRGDRGEFFTPRNVCNMTTSMCFSLFSDDDLTSPGGLQILDPAVGTGGFLISGTQWIKNAYEDRGYRSDQVRERVSDIADRNLFGIDFNPFLVQVAQMNMVMHGDGSSNIFHANSLEQPNKWTTGVRESVGLGQFDLIMTNPPFGSNAIIDDPDILEQYELGTYGTDSVRESIPPEQLFIERCLDFLKPGGILGIVLPDSILSNPGLEWIREWLLQEVNVLASVDLPVETFQPSTGTQTSVLILQKRRPTDKQEDYTIFMASPEMVGHDRRGNPVYDKTPDGDIKLDKAGRAIVNDDLPFAAEAFNKWVRQKGILT